MEFVLNINENDISLMYTCVQMYVRVYERYIMRTNVHMTYTQND